MHSHSQPQATTNVLSAGNISYKQNHNMQPFVFGFLPWDSVFGVYPCCSTYQHFVPFYWHIGRPSYWYAIFPLSVNHLMAVWVVFSLELFWIMVLRRFSHTSLWVRNPRVGISRLCGKIMLYFSGYCQIIFQSCCTITHSHQQCMRLPISPHLHQPLVSHTF